MWGVSQALFDDVIHHFPIRSRCVFKLIHIKNSGFFYGYFRKFFSFWKRRFLDMVHAWGIWEIFPFYHNLFLLFMFLYLSFIYHFYHGTFYAHCYFLIFIKDLPFSSFLLIIFNICKNLLFFDYKKSSFIKEGLPVETSRD